ncbi:hypothetical protein [Pseudomonas sp. N040]|uniref:hypothetical protein n=1 Tax=Pseudomonas sp. N040 TaxID=2785325 RepID=UPI0018A25444|nr:hypothetical protein [Pseudomonas sp. N040]MBF7731256.1 hypothetical protein [Pseudomonas sp. N040]MBW7014899.1 hypothetical protein [Pseudomonas sp. N040]
MLWRKTNASSTRELLRAEHQLQLANQGRIRFWPLALLLALSLALLGALLLRGTEQQAHAEQRAAWLADNQRLREQLEQERLQTREEQAAQEQLLRRIGVMSAQIKQLKTDLAFYRQQEKPIK